MTTFATLKTNVSRDLRDRDRQTFLEDDVEDLINAALAQVGRLAPDRFQEDIAPVTDTMTYIPLYDVFGVAVPEIELTRVEIWSTVETPNAPLCLVYPADQSYVNYSQTGWKLWGGTLELPRWVPVYIATNPSDYLIRIWGYAPYESLVTDDDVVPVSAELESAMRVYCRVEAMRRLMDDRNLFTQWQTRAGNTDVTAAALMNGFAQAQDEWHRLAKAIYVLREGPG